MNIAVIGTGDISHNFMREITKIEKTYVNIVWNRSQEKALSFSEEYGIPASTNDYRKIVESKEIDVIYIGLPNSLHFTFAQEALRHKKHVIVEKPIVQSMEQFNKLCSVAEENDVKIIEVTRVLDLPNFQVIKETLNQLGNISIVNISFCKKSRRYDDYLKGEMPNVFTIEYEGGALADLAIYGIHFAVSLFDKPIEVEYMCSKLKSGIDGSGCLALKYEGFVVNITVSKNSFEAPFVSIQGTHSALYSGAPITKLSDLILIGSNGSKEIGDFQEYDNFYYSLKTYVEIIESRDEHKYQSLLKQSRDVIDVLEQARASAGIKLEFNRFKQ